jgi:hypothetical protein
MWNFCGKDDDDDANLDIVEERGSGRGGGGIVEDYQTFVVFFFPNGLPHGGGGEFCSWMRCSPWRSVSAVQTLRTARIGGVDDGGSGNRPIS